MKMTVTQRLVLMAATAAGTVLISGVPQALAQKRLLRQAQYEAPVELPSAANEASMSPPMNEVIPRGVPSQNEPYAGMDYPGGSMLQDGEPLTQMQPSLVDELTGEDLQPQSYFGADGPAPIYSTGTWWWRGNWYTRGDVVVLDRSDVRDNLVLTGGDVISISGQRLGLKTFSTNQLAELNYDVGMRLTVGRFLGRDASHRDHMAEISYLGGLDWHAGKTVVSDVSGDSINTYLAQAPNTRGSVGGIFQGQFTFPLSLGAPAGSAQVYFDAATQSFNYSSNFNDFQMNYRLQSRPGKDAAALQPNGMWVQHAMAGMVTSMYCGLRLSTLDESVLYTSDRTVNAVPQSAQYQVSTNNDMFGLHYGGDLTQVHDDWSWGIRGGVGTLVNFVDRVSILASTIADTQTQKVTDERLAWAAETGIFSKYQIRPNLAFRAGYDFIYYANVAIATDNIGFENGFPALIADGPVYFQGGTAGFEATW